LRGEFNNDIPALLITGDTAPERLREIDAGNIPVLHKPLDEQILRAALLNAMRSDTTRVNWLMAIRPS
jgi:two-component system, sensor histidine kinase